MRFDRVSLRSSLQLGASTLLFDLEYQHRAYGAINLHGLDHDLGGSVRIVCDPMGIAFP